MRHIISAGLFAAFSMTAAFCAPALANPLIFDGNEYFLTSSAEGWTEAEAEAQADGGHLASIHSAAENQFIVDTFLSGSSASDVLWIGLYDPIQNDGSGAQHAADFVWTDSTSVDYTNWNTGTGEPNNYDSQEYWTAINWHYAASGTGAIGTWNDLPELGSDSYSVAVNGPYYGIVEVSVPEPRDLSVFALGLVGAGMVRHRRRGLKAA